VGQAKAEKEKVAAQSDANKKAADANVDAAKKQ
jgi:colicin import membrane protein